MSTFWKTIFRPLPRAAPNCSLVLKGLLIHGPL